MDGLLIIDKARRSDLARRRRAMRRALGERSIGHTGTLDPAATGVLPLVLDAPRDSRDSSAPTSSRTRRWCGSDSPPIHATPEASR